MNYVAKIRRHYADKDRWITVHPNGPDKTGSPVKIGPHGEVKGGMGGKFNGRHISAVSHHGENEQAGVQMVIDKTHQPKPRPSREKKPAAPKEKSGFSNNASIKEKVSETFHEGAAAAIERGSKLAVNAWKNFGGRVVVKNAREPWKPPKKGAPARPVAFFEPDLTSDDFGVHFDEDVDAKGSSWKKPYSIFFHESGHAIDFEARKKASPDHPYFSGGYKNGAFPGKIRDEIMGLTAKLTREFATLGANEFLKKYPENEDVVNELRRQGIYGRGKLYSHDFRYSLNMNFHGYRFLGGMLRGMPMGLAAILSDLAGGASVRGSGKTSYMLALGQTGHAPEYWAKARDGGYLDDMLATEAFAGMYSASVTNPEQLEFTRKYLPETVKLFEEMLKELGKNARRKQAGLAR